MSSTVWLSGRLCPASEATVPIGDRGLLFGDGVYDVYRVYGGRPFRMDQHLARLRRSAGEIRLALPDVDWARVHDDLLEANGLQRSDATVYIQVTRGAPEGRGHTFPPSDVPVTAFATARPLQAPARALYEAGAAAIVRPDIRWGRVDVKSLNLLPNVLATQDASVEGAWEAILVRDGRVTEGARTNAFAVVEGTVRTHPEGPHILPGITRAVVLELARALGIELVHTACSLDELRAASEVFLTGTTAELLPVTRLDGATIGDGAPGPTTRRLMAALASCVAAETRAP